MTIRSRLLPLALIAGALGLSLSARADIIDNWAQVKPPAPPKLQEVTIHPKTTALLMLDFLKQNCAPNPTCMANLPAVQRLLNAARQKKMLVIYSKYPGPTVADILPPVAPLGKEPVITAFLDKFLHTRLNRLLKKNHIKTVIAVGNAGNGAVLFTATTAFFLGYHVVVPVDGVSSQTPYADQSTIYDLAAAPVMGGKVKLTRTNMIKFFK